VTPVTSARAFARRFAQSPAAIAGALWLAFVAIASLAGPPLARVGFGLDAATQDVLLGATSPSSRHWFGTDLLGRDLLVRTIEGGRVALGVTLVATAVALVIGVAWGAVAGWVGGRVDEAMMRVVDVLYALPTVLVVLVVRALLDTRSEASLYALLGAISWLTLARIVRAEVRSLRHGGFVEAARALGASPARVLVRHVVPQAAGPVAVYVTLSMPNVLLAEALLSFLGLGVPPPRASWGALVYEGSRLMLVHPWTLVGPAAILCLTVLSLQLVGDGLRDALQVGAD
jgi:oligopeptide transport system permease protein